MEICVIEQQADAPAGLFADWALERGHRLAPLRGPEVEAWPDPSSFGAIVALGSDRSVHASSDPWIATQIAFLARAAGDDGVPVLGLCFGGQALAAALGGTVGAAPRAEIEWLTVEEARAPVAPGPWFTWHVDAFTVPPGAQALGRSDAGPQGFRLGSSVGLQFHPEVTPAIVAGWVASGRGALEAQRVDGEAIVAEAERGAPAARKRAFALFDAIAADWG